MKNYSMTMGGIIVMVVGSLLMDYGFTEGCAGEISNQVPLIIGAIVTYIGRMRKGDVTPLGFKK